MKNFSEDFGKRYHKGEFGLMGWVKGIDGDGSPMKLAQDTHLARWLRYMDWAGYHNSAKFFRYHARTTKIDGGLTLPDIDPWNYDITYNPPLKNPWRLHPSENWFETSPGRRRDEMTSVERKELADEVRKMIGLAGQNMTMFPDEPKGKHPAPEKPKTKTLAELQQEAIDNPVQMSPGLAARLGLKGKPDGE